MLSHRGTAQQRGIPTRAPGDCPCSRDRSVAAGALGIARNGQRRWIHTRSRPSRRTVRGSMSKHDRFFDKLERRAPRKRCRRCRQKFTPPAGHSNLICPACVRENRENRLMRPGPPRNPMRETAAPRKTSRPNVFSPTEYGRPTSGSRYQRLLGLSKYGISLFTSAEPGPVAPIGAAPSTNSTRSASITR